MSCVWYLRVDCSWCAVVLERRPCRGFLAVNTDEDIVASNVLTWDITETSFGQVHAGMRGQRLKIV
jgi:hypothetical protein